MGDNRKLSLAHYDILIAWYEITLLFYMTIEWFLLKSAGTWCEFVKIVSSTSTVQTLVQYSEVRCLEIFSMNHFGLAI